MKGIHVPAPSFLFFITVFLLFYMFLILCDVEEKEDTSDKKEKRQRRAKRLKGNAFPLPHFLWLMVGGCGCLVFSSHRP